VPGYQALKRSRIGRNAANVFPATRALRVAAVGNRVLATRVNDTFVLDCICEGCLCAGRLFNERGQPQLAGAV
jgi:hypothetical protein